MQSMLFRILRVTLRLILWLVGSVRFFGAEHIPVEGPFIVVVNHMSKADIALVFLGFPIPPLLIRFFAGEKWQKHLLYGPILGAAGAVFINRGEVDREALREATAAIRGGEVFGLAPEGTRSRAGSLIRGRDGAAYLATRTGVPLLPVGLANTDEIGANVMRLRRTEMTCRIGRPFHLPDLGRRPRSSDLAAYTHLIMVHIAALLPARHWGVYADSPALAALQRGADPWPHCLAAEGITAG